MSLSELKQITRSCTTQRLRCASNKRKPNGVALTALPALSWRQETLWPTVSHKPYERQPFLQLYSSDSVGSPAADNASAAHRRRKNPVVQPLPIPLILFRNRLFSPEMTVVFRAAPAAGIRGKFRVHGMFTLMVWESQIILLQT